MSTLNIKNLLKTTLKVGNRIVDKFALNIIARKLSRDLYKEECVLIDLSLIGDILVALPYYYRLFKGSTGKFKLSLVSSYTTMYILRKIGLDVIPLDFRRFMYLPLYRIKFIKRIGKVRYTVISHPNRTEEMEDVCLKLLSEYKIAYEGETIYEEFKEKRNLGRFSHIIYNPYCHKIIHISKHLDILFGSLSSILDIERINYEIKREDFSSIFRKHFSGLFPTRDYIVILTDASVRYRKYSRDKWQAIINSIPKYMRIFQLGLNKFPLQHPNLIDLTGKTSLEEAMSIVMNASLVIGNETGLTHLAYLSGVPTVCILGGGHFGRFLPWPEFDDVVKCVYKPMDCFQCGWRCKYVNLQKGEVPPCISQIPPESVLTAIENLNERYKIFS